MGLLFYQAYLDPLHKRFLDKIIAQLEKNGFRVIALYSYPAYKAIDFFLKEKVPLNVLVSFAFKMSASANDRTLELLNMLNVPIINAINLFSESIEDWKKSPVGLSSFEVSWQVNMPEISGLVEPTVVSGKTKSGRDYETIEEQVEF